MHDELSFSSADSCNRMSCLFEVQGYFIKTKPLDKYDSRLIITSYIYFCARTITLCQKLPLLLRANNNTLSNNPVKIIYTLQPLYNTVRYNTVLDITRFNDGSQKCIDYIHKWSFFNIIYTFLFGYNTVI